MKHQGSLIGRIALWVIAALGIVFVIMIFSGNETGIDGALWLTYAVMGLCMAIALIYAVVEIVRAGKKALPTLLGIAAFAVVVIIAYMVSSDTVKPTWTISSTTSQFIGAGLITTYIALGAAVLAILFGEVTRMLK